MNDFLESKIVPSWGLMDPHMLKKDAFKKPEEEMVYNKHLFRWVKKEDFD